MPRTNSTLHELSASSSGVIAVHTPWDGVVTACMQWGHCLAPTAAIFSTVSDGTVLGAILPSFIPHAHVCCPGTLSDATHSGGPATFGGN